MYQLLKKYKEIKKEIFEDNQKEYSGPHCCVMMDYYVNASNDEKVFPIVYKSRFREYYLQAIKDQAGDQINFCPSCGTKLPEGLSDTWFYIIEQEYQLNPWVPQQREKIPSEYFDDNWWKKLDL